MTKNFETDIKHVNSKNLNSLIVEGVNPDLMVQIHQYIDALVLQKIKEEEARLENTMNNQ